MNKTFLSFVPLRKGQNKEVCEWAKACMIFTLKLTIDDIKDLNANVDMKVSFYVSESENRLWIWNDAK